MFDSIFISTHDRNSTQNPLDIGWLVECLLFYSKITILANHSIINQLVRYFGVTNLAILVEENTLEILYSDFTLSVLNRNVNGVELLDMGEITVVGKSYQDTFREICIAKYGKPGKGRRKSQKLENLVKLIDHDLRILEGARAAIIDRAYIERAAKIVIGNLLPEYNKLSELNYFAIKSESELRVITNLDFEELNALYHKKVPPSHSTITNAYIFSHILDIEKEIFYSSMNQAELSSSQLSSSLAKLKIETIISNSQQSQEGLNNFSTLVFDDAKTIREQVNSNAVDVADIMQLISKSKKFKSWLSGLDSDRSLLKEYHEAVLEDTIFEKLPGKSIRWSIFTGIGVVADTLVTGGLGTLAGVSVSALDGFFMDKLLKGWKPNTFINKYCNGIES